MGVDSVAMIAINLSVEDPERFKSALAEAQGLGLKLDATFEDLGVASGSVDSRVLPSLRRVRGLNFEADRQNEAALPPGSKQL